MGSVPALWDALPQASKWQIILFIGALEWFDEWHITDGGYHTKPTTTAPPPCAPPTHDQLMTNSPPAHHQLTTNPPPAQPLLDQTDARGVAVTCIRNTITGACLAWHRFLADPAGITSNVKDAAKTAKDMPDWAAVTPVGRGISAMNLTDSRGVLQTTEQAFNGLMAILEARGCSQVAAAEQEPACGV